MILRGAGLRGQRATGPGRRAGARRGRAASFGFGWSAYRVPIAGEDHDGRPGHLREPNYTCGGTALGGSSNRTGEWCNSSAGGFGPSSPGSNPGSPAFARSILAGLLQPQHELVFGR